MGGGFGGELGLRATSHMRLRVLGHCTSRTLISGKGGAGPSTWGK